MVWVMVDRIIGLIHSTSYNRFMEILYYNLSVFPGSHPYFAEFPPIFYDVIFHVHYSTRFMETP